MDKQTDSTKSVPGKRLWISSALWVLLLSVVLVTATYAWLTFEPIANVTPMGGTISNGDVSLLIANRADGEFAESCELRLEGNFQELMPVTTADLSSFYESALQSRTGISLAYRTADIRLNTNILHGTVYLTSRDSGCNVYLYQSGSEISANDQTLGALRLGMRIVTQSQIHNYIFRVDAFGNGSTLESIQTVPNEGTVVAGLASDGNANYVTDPSVEISRFFAREQRADDLEPTAGEELLCSIAADEVVSVEYWLYLEGCDENCINEVQSQNLNLQLSFAGVSAAE